jgi:hypothetical protein
VLSQRREMLLGNLGMQMVHDVEADVAASRAATWAGSGSRLTRMTRCNARCLFRRSERPKGITWRTGARFGGTALWPRLSSLATPLDGTVDHQTVVLPVRI